MQSYIKCHQSSNITERLRIRLKDRAIRVKNEDRSSRIIQRHIRVFLNRSVGTRNKGLVLGDESFIDKLEKQTKRPIRFFSRGWDRKSERFKNQLLCPLDLCVTP